MATAVDRCSGRSWAWGNSGLFSFTAPGQFVVTHAGYTRADRLGCYGYTQALTPELDALRKTECSLNVRMHPLQ